MNDVKITSNLWRGVYDEVVTAVGAEARIKVRNKVRTEVWEKVWDKVWAEVDEVEYKVRVEVKKIKL